MAELLGPDGMAIASSDFEPGGKRNPKKFSGQRSANHTKGDPPITGEAFGIATGPKVQNRQFANGFVVQFNLNQLTLDDYRQMTYDPQINMSLSVLMFMLHQLEFTIECENAQIAALCEKQLRDIWSVMVRAMSQSFTFGFSPSVLQWENDIYSKSVVLTKVKDLNPAECTPVWKYVDGYTSNPQYTQPPQLAVYDGFKQQGFRDPIPASNSLWYPFLMSNGDMYGRKMLKPAFIPWYFSMMLHNHTNNYYERFAEPVPIGRAPLEDELVVNGETMSGGDLMAGTLRDLRARRVVTLPSTRSVAEGATSGAGAAYDYDISYLQSEMRGADFDKYLSRLEEEKTLAVFTPTLVTRTADVGSYNLGTGQWATYTTMLNAVSGDWKYYIDNYVLNRMVDYNFSIRAPRAKISFRPLGRATSEILQTMIQAVLTSPSTGVRPDLVELGQLAGVTLNEVEVMTAPQEATPATVSKDTVKSALASIRVDSDGFVQDVPRQLDYRAKMQTVLREAQYPHPEKAVDQVYRRVESWMAEFAISRPHLEEMHEKLEMVLETELAEARAA